METKKQNKKKQTKRLVGTDKIAVETDINMETEMKDNRQTGNDKER